MTSVQTLDGVGETLTEKLQDEDIESVRALSDATEDDLTSITGVGTEKATMLITTAVNALHTDDSDDNGDGVGGSDTDTDEDTDTDTDTTSGETYTNNVDITVEMDATVSPHVLNACLSEIRRLLRRNNVAELRDLEVIVNEIRDSENFPVFDPTSDERVTLDVSLTPERVTALYRSINSQATDYRRDGSLSSVGGKLQQVADKVNMHRPVNQSE